MFLSATCQLDRSLEVPGQLAKYVKPGISEDEAKAFLKEIQTQMDPKKLVRKLAREDLRVKDQLRVFEETTGLKRRTFFKYRRALNVSR
jgi:hypothetical protein